MAGMMAESLVPRTAAYLVAQTVDWMEYLMADNLAAHLAADSVDPMDAQLVGYWVDYLVDHLAVSMAGKLVA